MQQLPTFFIRPIHAGETPVCVLYTGGGCDINDPSSDDFCTAGQDDCPRLDTVNDAYDTASKTLVLGIVCFYLEA